MLHEAGGVSVLMARHVLFSTRFAIFVANAVAFQVQPQAIPLRTAD